MPANSTPGPICRVRCVPERSSMSLRGSGVEAAGTNGRDEDVAMSAEPVAASSPPGATTSSRACGGVAAPARGADAVTLCPTALESPGTVPGLHPGERGDQKGHGLQCRRW